MNTPTILAILEDDDVKGSLKRLDDLAADIMASTDLEEAAALADCLRTELVILRLALVAGGAQ